MSESKRMRKRVMSILRRLAPEDYHRAIAREKEADTVAKNVWKVRPIVKGLREAA